MNDVVIYALVYGLVAVEVFLASVLSFWIGCKIFGVEFDLKTAAAIGLLMVLLKGI